MKSWFGFFVIAGLCCVLTGCGMNGKLIQPSKAPFGMCTFTINNLYEDDIVVKVYNVKDLNTVVHYVYVGSDNSATIKNVAPGNYIIRYSKGQDWDSDRLLFKKNRENYETDQKFEFTETEKTVDTDGGKQTTHYYSQQVFTLGSKSGKGNMTTSKIDDEEFAK